MKFDERQEQETLITRPLETRLDSHVAEELKTHLKDIVHNGHQQIILDLGEVEFVDSSGLGAIIAAMMALRPQGRLMVCNVKGSVYALFRLTRIDRLIPVLADVEAALQAMSKE